MKFKLSDMPEFLRKQIQEQIDREDAINKPEDPVPVLESKKPKMTKTELLYERVYLNGIHHKFEGITLKMNNGHRYSPDWYVVRDGKIELHEVKGSYKLQSYGRAKLAFDQCKTEFPEFKFVWATKNANGGFDLQ